MILDALKESGGWAVSVPEETIPGWMQRANRAEGIGFCPETGACIGAVNQLVETGWIEEGEEVVVFNTGAVQKYPETIARELPSIDCSAAIDWEAFEELAAE